MDLLLVEDHIFVKTDINKAWNKIISLITFKERI